MMDMDNKKHKELQVYKEALSLARATGGEGRRNAIRLAGPVDASKECPDLTISTSDGRLVGIEHFRVDQLVKHDKRVQSAAAEFSKYTEKRRMEVLANAESDAVTNDMIECLGERIDKAILLVRNACLDDLNKSLDARLFGEGGHASKIEKYRKNLSRVADGKKIQIGYLIEFHSDFGGLFLNGPMGTRRIRPGEMPLFSGVFNLLERAACDVDWMIFAFYDSLGENMKSAAVIRCANGMFKKSAERQGLHRTEYLGLGKSESRRGGRSRVSCIDQSMGRITYAVEKDSRDISLERMQIEAFRGAARAISLMRSGASFTATLPVQMLYEIVCDRAKMIRCSPDERVVSMLLHQMGLHECMLRSDRFGQKWGIETASTPMMGFEGLFEPRHDC